MYTDELHKSRLLSVEEKPFKRVTRRILSIAPSKLATPPPEPLNDEEVAAEAQKQIEERRQFREDVLLDFAAFDSSIVRIQHLYAANERERERYVAERLRILDTAQEVRVSTAQLREQLEAAKQTLEQRKKFDVLAEKITHNRMLRPREDQEVNLRKLEEECAELERERETYAQTWQERKEQFGKIVEEGQQLRRLIRDEKEEVERREGMDGEEEDVEAGDGSRGGATPRYNSGGVTPRPDGSTPRHRSTSRGGTPGRESPENEKREGLRPKPLPRGGHSNTGTRVSSRAGSPQREQPEEGEDVNMADAAEKSLNAQADLSMVEGASTPRVVVDEPANDQEDKMDTT